MQRMTAIMVVGFFWALASAGGWAQTPNTTTQHLEHLMVENADTPAEHQALARYYRMKANDSKSLAEEHRLMGERYRGKPGQVRNLREHCNRIAELNDELAARYESLAKGEEAASTE